MSDRSTPATSISNLRQPQSSTPDGRVIGAETQAVVEPTPCLVESALERVEAGTRQQDAVVIGRVLFGLFDRRADHRDMHRRVIDQPEVAQFLSGLLPFPASRAVQSAHRVLAELPKIKL